ncbi:MAG: SH3 domain-containing protein, partial [Anaerolineae bacterium]|nr:SH3 domain-containing protein [Anaerolineae bacterium]
MRRYENPGSGRLMTSLLVLLGAGAVIVMLLQNRDVPPEKMAVVPTIRPTLLADLPTETATVTLTASATTTTTPTLTPTLTETPVPTVIPPSETPGEPSETAFQTFTPLPTPPCQTIVVNGSGAFVRSGPGVSYEALESVPQNIIFEVMGFLQAQDGLTWYNIKLLDG